MPTLLMYKPSNNLKVYAWNIGIQNRLSETLSNWPRRRVDISRRNRPRRLVTTIRVKDLVDMVLLIERGDLDTGQVRQAIIETFSRRKTHEQPDILKQPPATWAVEFPIMAKQADLYTTDITEAFDKLLRFKAKIDRDAKGCKQP
ncbi:MAG: hypothetical protein JXA11_12245 [Phycisphaerae bacterium]|nr:hypothetical protein [Phycisphaerae bacterium]